MTLDPVRRSWEHIENTSDMWTSSTYRARFSPFIMSVFMQSVYIRTFLESLKMPHSIRKWYQCQSIHPAPKGVRRENSLKDVLIDLGCVWHVSDGEIYLCVTHWKVQEFNSTPEYGLESLMWFQHQASDGKIRCQTQHFKMFRHMHVCETCRLTVLPKSDFRRNFLWLGIRRVSWVL